MSFLASATVGCARPLSPAREIKLLRKFCEARGDEPSRCSHTRTPAWAEQSALNSSDTQRRFQALLVRRPGGTKEYCGMVLNHVYALFVTLEALQPRVVVESGVLTGQGTWLIRQVLPAARIFSLDPGVELDSLLWRDPSPLTTYLLGRNFTDFSQLDWLSLVPRPATRANGLVVLDDHMSSVRRTAEVIDAGFGHVFYEDNWKYLGQGQRSPLHSDCYSFNTLCSWPLPLARPIAGSNGTAVASSVLYQDHFGKTQLFITREEHEANLAFILGHVISYVEFPALFDACLYLPHPDPSSAASLQIGGGDMLFAVGSRPRAPRTRAALLGHAEASRLFRGRLDLVSWSSYYPPYLKLKRRFNASLLFRTTPYLHGRFRPNHGAVA